ncbi:hypothetical protein M8C21_025668 [Ambrosia artemisiifolia]|uniref:SAM domain-containing protein n=1 Tax=Ambrosia artemisiifolia TaxID=4212 RepID=A0AAD5GR84_AMBAR|nr:hypothetical protein M8C21_025668 [Ambrosia artemisiifolia]
MGISIAKHRLEILKLARKSSGLHPMGKLIEVVKKTKRTLARYIRTWVNRNDSAMVMVKTRSYSLRWKAAMVKRSNRLVMNKQGPPTLLLTNGYRTVVGSSGAKMNNFSGSSVNALGYDASKEDGGECRENLHSDDKDSGDKYCSGKSVEHIKWDTMFQNLKPT